jgi:hypothetical protein
MKFRVFTGLIISSLFASIFSVPAFAAEKPVVESVTFTPTEIDLQKSNLNVSIELTVSHPDGIENKITTATFTNAQQISVSTVLTRTDSPVNYKLQKVIFRGSLTVPGNLTPGAYTLNIDSVKNYNVNGYQFSSDSIKVKKVRDLVGAENSLLVRNGGLLNLNYETFIGPSYDSKLNLIFTDPIRFNSGNIPIFKVGEIYDPKKFFETSVPELSLKISTSTPNICSSTGSELKFLAEGNCSFVVYTPANSDYLEYKYSTFATITAPRIKPVFAVNKLPNVTVDSIGKTIEISRVFTPVSGYIEPKNETPTICFAQGTFLKIIQGGTCTISYQSPETNDYLASENYKITFEIIRSTQSITFTPINTAAVSSKTIPLSAVSSSGGTVTFSTLSTDNCSISGSTLNLLKSGNCVVTASQAGTPTLAPVSVTATIVLTSSAITPKPVITKKSIVCIKGKTTKKVSGTNPKCPKGYKLKK